MSALYSNTTGTHNTASGWNSLYSNTTGYYNTAIGVDALRTNTTGYVNTALGLSALYSNTTGTYNTASGWNSLYSNTTGELNTASGANALYSNTTGYYNTASGVSALYSNTTGTHNTASGVNALYNNTAGINNTAVGYNTGLGITTGSGNTILGANVASLTDTLTNNIILANGLGTIKARHNGTSWELTDNVGIGTTSPAYRLEVKSALIPAALSANITNKTYAEINGTDPGIVYGGDGGGLVIAPLQGRGAHVALLAVETDSNKEGVPQFVIYTGGTRTTSTEKMRVDHNGNVGIGMTPSSAHRLDVNGKIGGSVFADGYLEFRSTGNTTLRANNTVNIGYLDTVNVTNDGKVGIGNAGPVYDVDLIKTTAGGVVSRIRNSSADATAEAVLVLNAFGNSWGLSMGSMAKNSNALTWISDYGNGNTERLRLTVAGNVGIGTANPTAKLDVNGAANITGALTVAGPVSRTSGSTAGVANGAYIVVPVPVTYKALLLSSATATNETNSSLHLIGSDNTNCNVAALNVFETTVINHGSEASVRITNASGITATVKWSFLQLS